jgi:hypothetical protein
MPVSDNPFVIASTAVKTGQLLERFKIEIAIIAPELLDPVVVKLFQKISPVKPNSIDRHLSRAFQIATLTFSSCLSN